MSLRDAPRDIPLYLLILIIITFIAGRFAGAYLFDNNWSFIHWQHVPAWYIVGWFLFFACILILLVNKIGAMSLLFDSRKRVIAAAVVMTALFVAFQFDSILYGGGNYLVGQIAQTDTIIHRWYEYGTIWVVTILFEFFSLFNLHYNTAGVMGWKVYAFAGSVLTLIAALKLAGELAREAASRVLYFIVLFFGPHTLLYFGFVGVEPFLVAVVYWFALYAFRLNREFTVGRLCLLWLITGLGTLLQVTMLMLAPAAVFVTLRSSVKLGRVMSFAIGASAYVSLLAATYLIAGGNLEYARYILFPRHWNLQESYGLFSLRHIGDIVQLLFLFCPQILVLKYLFFKSPRLAGTNANILTSILLVLAGNTMVVILEPQRGIVLDAVRLAAYLSPLSLMAVLYLSQSGLDAYRKRILTALFAATSLAIPFSTLPAYTRIDVADSYVEDYLDKNEYFYHEGCIAFRDAYFQRKDFEPADSWEWKLPTKSQDFMDLKAAKEYSLAEMYPEALSLLYRIKTRHMFWTEPRHLLATIQTKLQRYDLARPEIDTCLLLEPYNRQFLISHYRYYRDIKDIPGAIRNVNLALKVYPDDDEIRTDLMIYLYRAGAISDADSLASRLLERDSTLPFPYLILGFIDELNNNPDAAIKNFEKFITLAPDEAETPQVRKRLNKLVLKRQHKQ